VTANWTFLPGDWSELRRRWEYSHAAGAALNLAALVALLVCLFWTNEMQPSDLESAQQGYTSSANAQGTDAQSGRAPEPAREAQREQRRSARYM
jgi:hypothetical protein